MGRNEKRWSRSKPGLLIILLDQSCSMLAKYKNGSTVETKSELASRMANNIVEEIISLSWTGQLVKDICFIAIVGYSKSAKMLASGFLRDFDDNPICIETVKQKISDGADGFVTIDKKMPVWIEPITLDDATDLKGAFQMAKEVIDNWIKDKPEYPAPVIFNICGGIPSYEYKDVVGEWKNNVMGIVDQIKGINMKDGKIQIYNAIIGDDPSHNIDFPVSDTELPLPEAKFWFDISTVVPISYKVSAEQYGISIRDGAHGVVFDANGMESLMDILPIRW